ncbi:MAG: hypothetical protein LKH27_08110 [Prevotella sp.]|jgi:hypothetical protein|nr:hypothetical protein [Prevotella sp.]MCH3993038.1 hypothetical protein [Prevotella sp.]MCI1474361.1 hypothetical protein [Prevotella sp.]MCI1596083.1 hypothetical protein [Prevotella sp.]
MNIYEKILAALKTKFVGVDDAVLQRIATNKSQGVTDEKQITAIVDGIKISDVLKSYGDYRADDAQKTAVQNYETKYNIKDGKAIVDPKKKPVVKTPNATPPKPEDKPDVSEQISTALEKALKPITDQLVSFKTEAKQKEWGAKVEEAAKSFKIPKFAYQGKTIPEDTDLNKYFTDLKQEMANSGFAVTGKPDEASKDTKTEMGNIAAEINKGTDAIVKERETNKN